MKIPENKQHVLSQKLDEFWGDKKQCPICGRGDWSIDEHVFQLMEFHGGAFLASGSLKPLIAITCGTVVTCSR